MNSTKNMVEHRIIHNVNVFKMSLKFQCIKRAICLVSLFDMYLGKYLSDVKLLPSSNNVATSANERSVTVKSPYNSGVRWFAAKIFRKIEMA